MAEERDLAAVYIALGSGGTNDAVLAAIRCFDAGRQEPVVLATLVKYGAPDDPRVRTASSAIELVDLAMAVVEKPSDDRWEALLDALLAADQIDDAWHGVRLAWRDGVATEATWQHLVGLLLERGDVEAATAVAWSAAESVAGSATLWAAAGMLAADRGLLGRADEAVENAHRIDARNPAAWTARARLAWARGDDASGARAAYTAIELGAPRSALDVMCASSRVLYLLGR